MPPSQPDMLFGPIVADFDRVRKRPVQYSRCGLRAFVHPTRGSRCENAGVVWFGMGQRDSRADGGGSLLWRQNA